MTKPPFERAQTQQDERRVGKQPAKMFSREQYREDLARVTKRKGRGDYDRNPDDMTHLRDLVKTLPEEVQLDIAKARRKRKANEIAAQARAEEEE